MLRLAAAASVAALAAVLNPWIFDGLYERLTHKMFYKPEFRFLHVVENRSGVITVYPDGTFLGGGRYDGSVNTSIEKDRNGVHRAYAISGLHARPREILMVGLSTGSWAMVVAENPEVERLTVVEINRGYLELVRKFPEVAGVLTHPKVRIEIDDARRWLLRNRDRKFDMIISNTTQNWRSHVTSLLSVEFLELVRSRLNPGGIFFYGTTGSHRAARTGLTVFPHGVHFNLFMAVGDQPVGFHPERWKQAMRRHRRMGLPIFDPADPAAEDRLDQLAAAFGAMYAPCDELRRTLANAPLLTDDNMGVEWSQYPLD
jgi:spermidine synthase